MKFNHGTSVTWCHVGLNMELRAFAYNAPCWRSFCLSTDSCSQTARLPGSICSALEKSSNNLRKYYKLHQVEYFTKLQWLLELEDTLNYIIVIILLLLLLLLYYIILYYIIL